MKIPTYQRQTTFPKQAGAQFLNVSANPSALSAPGAALADLGGRIQTEGLRWLEKELVTERAATQAHNENNFRDKLNDTRQLAKEQPVDKWTDHTYSKQYPRPGVPDSVIEIAHQIRPYQQQRQFMETGLYNLAATQAAGISNRTTRQRFLTSAHKDIAAAMPEISAALRARYKDFANGVLIENITVLEREIASMPGGRRKEEKLKELNQRVAFWAEWGNFGEKATKTELKKSAKRIDTHDFNARYANSKTPEDADAILSDLETGEWESFDADDVGRLMVKVSKRGDQLNNREIARIESEEKRQDKKYNKKRKENFENTAARILATRAALANDVEPPESMDDIRDEVLKGMAKRDFVTPNDGRALLEMIDGKDTILDQDYSIEMFQQINEAMSEGELDQITTDFQKQYDTRRIGGKLYLELESRVKQRRGKTEQTEQSNEFRIYLRTMLGDTVIDPMQKMMHNIMKVSSKDGPEKVDLALALKYYDGLVNIENKRPAQAFYDTIVRHFDPQKQKAVALNIIRNFNDEIANVLGYKPGMDLTDERLKTLLTPVTLEDAQRQLSLWARGKKLPKEALIGEDGIPPTVDDLGMLQRQNKIKPQQRLTARRLYEMNRQIKFLSRYKHEPIPKPKDAKKEDNPEEQNNAENEAGREFLEEIENWVRDVVPEWMGGNPSADENETDNYKTRGMGK